MKAKYLFFTLILLGSCNLERFPLTNFSENNFFKDENEAKLVLTSLYRGNILYNNTEWSPSDWWGPSATVFLDGVTDIGYDRRDFTNDIGRLTSGGILNTNQYVNALWKQPYKRIASCNRFLENIKKVPSSQSVDVMKAEARFIRAAQYFYIASYYGDSPLVTKVLTQEESNTVKKETRQNLINFVVTEMDEISKVLPHTKDIASADIGRASAQAALAFKAKMLLFNKQYEEAAQALQLIIEWDENEIAQDYATLFTTNENSTENIFSVQFADNVAGHGMPQHVLPRKDDGWCLVSPTASLFESYDFIDGTPFSYTDSKFDKTDFAKNRDPRLRSTIIYDGVSFMGGKYNCHPEKGGLDKIGSSLATKSGYLLRKYFTDSKIQNLKSYGSNIPVVRYADVLLMYLEAKLESGATIDQSLLDATINKVRLRTSVNMPPITETDPDLLRDIIRKERKIELAFEGHRLWDLIRWGIAEQELNKDIFGAPFDVSDPSLIRKKDGTPDIYNRWYVNTRSFKSGQEIWPIPQSEIDINPNLR